jgi:hypothetical protein
VGQISDPIWQKQEANAEYSDFVVYQHEFKKDSEELNPAGEDHVKQIAARLVGGQEIQVVVERDTMSVDPKSEFKYPVNSNPELDMRRREIVARSLAAMGVPDADQRVSVAPAFAQGFTGPEAEAAYQRGVTSGTYGQQGMGGFGGFWFSGGGFF